MNKKLAQIRLLKINQRVIIGRKESSIPELRQFFEDEDGSEIVELYILSFDEKPRGTDMTWGAMAEKAEFNLEDLPVFL